MTWVPVSIIALFHVVKMAGWIRSNRPIRDVVAMIIVLVALDAVCALGLYEYWIE